MEYLAQVLVLLGLTVAVVVTFQRLHIPTSLGYLLVGMILSPHTMGPSLNVPEFRVLAEFGVVFLLFTIGLNYSLPQLGALRHQVLILGTLQVLLTTLVVAVIVWMVGVPPVPAFVLGAVFAQSSSTVIGALLAEQGEDNTPHARLGLAMSVFQDVTSVPFMVIIPALGLATATADVVAGTLGWVLAKAVIGFVVVLVVGRRLLRPLFHAASRRRSAEVFTLTVLLVVLVAAWSTSQFGLSLAFGAFLAGMMLGETEFRHQVESSIRPFRDVLLGLFFVGIGALFDPGVLPDVWHWALLGGVLLLGSKILLVAPMVLKSGLEATDAWRVALLLAVGGEFGFAIIAVAINAGALDVQLGQIALVSVLFSIVAGAVLIRFNGPIAAAIARVESRAAGKPELQVDPSVRPVLLGGYGRVGHAIAVLLRSCNVPFIAFDMDLKRVALGRAEGDQVMYGDISDPELLTAVRVDRAALVVVTVDNAATVQRAVAMVAHLCPQVPVIARARDLDASRRLLQAGAARAYPETIEASLRLGETALEMLNVPAENIQRTLQEVRDWGYGPVIEDKPPA